MNKIKNIYIHIPFCNKKCSFCDFSIYAIGSGSSNKQHFDMNLSQQYIDSLVKEINFIGDNYSDKFVNDNLQSIYLGGGTPTLLQPKLIEKILDSLSKYFKFDKENTEISLESDPNTFDSAKLNYYTRNLPFNRLTMGVQSLNPKVFEHLNRSHSIEDTIKSIELLKKSDFQNNFGVDLIQGLPEQTLEAAMNDLNFLTQFDIPHLSVYMLSLELNSSLFKKYKKEYNSEKKQNEIADMFIYTHEYLNEQKYDHYEISNFCKDKKYSKHNKSYWDGFSQFYGFGNSSSSYAFGKRFKKPKSIKKYYSFNEEIAKDKNYFEEFINKNDENKDIEIVGDSNDIEYINLKFLLLNQIRRAEGINLKEIKYNFGDKYFNCIKEYFLNKKSKFTNLNITNDNEYASVTFPEGALISDEILIDLFKLIEK